MGDSSLPLLVAMSVVLLFLGGFWLLFLYYNESRRQLRSHRLLARRSEGMLGGDGEAEEPERGFFETMLRLFGSGKAAPGRDDETRVLLARAGFRGERALLVFSAVRLVVPLVAAGYFVARTLADPALGLKGWLYAFAAFAVGYLLPKYVLASLAKRRQRKLTEELPLFVDFLWMLQGVGLNMEQSLMIVAEARAGILPILSGEMREVFRTVAGGRTRTVAMERMAAQLGIQELRDLVTMITQADQYGGAIQEPLRQFSRQMVERRRFAMQESIGKTAAKMAMVMVTFLMPALVLVTAGPGFRAVVRTLSNSF